MNQPIDVGEQEDLQEAGVHMITAMGYLSTIMPLVEKYGRTADEWVNTEARTVYNILLLDYRKSKVSYNLAQIKKRNSKFNK